MNPYATLIVFAAAFVVSQGLAAINVTTAKESAITARESEGKCFCQTNMTVNIPPCTCSGMVETVAENQQLKAEVKELRDNCTVVVNSLSPLPYGSCTHADSHCFGRLPAGLEERDSELLAIDSAGSIYRWHFNPSNPTAHAVWNALYHHLDQKVVNSRSWDPFVIAGPSPNVPQDSFMYRVQNRVRSFLLDDDNCDCYSTLSMGHGMCSTGFSTSYGPSGRFGVDLLYDTYCQTPDPKHGLSLYFRDDDDCEPDPCPIDKQCVDKVNSYICA